MDIAWLILAAVAGVALGWFARVALAASRPSATAERDRADVAQANAQAAEARAEAAAARAELARAEADTERARQEAAAARADVAEAAAREAATRAEVRRAELERDTALTRAEALQKDREAMANQYQTLSAEALERQSKAAEATAEQRLKATEQLVTPMRQALDDLREKMAQLDKERATAATELAGQVKLVRETGEQVTRETRQLTAALRRPQTRGRWGEQQLRRVVEMAGMVDHCDFLEQSSATADERRIRPDLKVLLAGGKFVYVDAKVPLEAFLDAQEATEEAVRDKHLKRFAQNVRGHIDSLASKRYWEVDTATPDFTVLFIPSEGLAGQALEVAPDLMEYAARRQIVVATPTTLIALLWTVAHAWKQAALAESAREVTRLGQDLYARLATMGSHFDRLGRSLMSSVKNYNDTVGSLETRVLVAARRFQDLQVSGEPLDAPQLIELAPRPIHAIELAEAVEDLPALLGPAPGED
ncbi:MAG: DNA recombination protein RmuC [Propionibacteriaceae bacterium]|nr:DNA recombination protein RmuC [Propionibacteriaceae bacterium]